jgi:hypothetical protein
MVSSMKSFLKRHVGAVVAATLGLAVIGGGAAAAATATGASRPAVDLAAATAATPGPSTSPNSGRHAGHAGRLARLARRAVHGDVIVKTKNGYETVTFDRGTVSAASASSITIQRPDGVSVTEGLSPTTRYKGISGAIAVATGRPAIVISHDGTALAVAQRPLPTGSSPSSGSGANNPAGS